MELISILLLVFPLLGFLAIGLMQRRMSELFAGVLASSVIFINLCLTGILFQYVNSLGHPLEIRLFDWIKFADINIPFSLTIDHLSLLMLLIVNGVSFLIHVYSIGYMKGDEGAKRFFAYLNLFVFFMLILVLSSGYLMLFIGWEGVGLCSYLLIGFWYKDQANNNAAKKAFIMNRIGDLGFLGALFLMFTTFKTLTISEVLSKASLMPSGNTILFFITLSLLIGATGKSAQLPLFTWLPDAMAGPTPVSALIHAATMVTAGIYLIARSGVMFLLSPVTMNIILIVGMATAVVGGLTAIRQNDIKKVLAYSTVSQLGFMFMALGLGSFTGAMFHLTTHAFFKALLFLGAGSVIHALGGEQDIRRMGGLGKKIPLTFILFFIATVSISGIPPFAGFFSKEQILTAAYQHGMWLGIITTAIALITTIYMFRLLFLVFVRKESQAVVDNKHIHESPRVMTFPMIVLGVLSIVGGWIQWPSLLGHFDAFNNFLAPVFETVQKINPVVAFEPGVLIEWLIMIIPLIIIAILILLSYNSNVRATELRENKGFGKLLERKFYFDEIYDFLIVKPLGSLSGFLREFIDQTVINGLVNAVGSGTLFAGKKLRRLQTGNVGIYVMLMVFSVIAILFFNILF